MHTWIHTPDALETLVERLSSEPRIGVDTEFHRERTYYAQLALVQLSWSDGIALVDPLAVDITPLKSLFDNPDTTIIFHAAEQDLEVIQRACGSIPARIFDTQVAAGFAGFSTPSLVSLVERLLGARPAKGDRLSDWLQRPLDDAQRTYAAADVEYLLALHDELVARLVASGRLDWAVDECELLRVKSRGTPNPDRAWWKIKDARALRGKARSVAQAVAAWRERQAMATDQPVRWVLPDLALVAIAQRPPRTLEELRAIRGLDGRYLRDGAGRGVLEAVKVGQALPDDRLEVPPVEDEIDRPLRPALSLFTAWAAQRAGELDLDPALLATRSDLQGFLRDDASSRLHHGWRSAILGAELRALLDGSVAISFERGRGLVMCDRVRRDQPPEVASGT
jgi:ribonuclease D